MHPDFRIGQWTVRPSLQRIEQSGKSVKLEPRPMEVLVALADADGAVLSRDELLESIWVDVVVGEEALTRTISELRRALGDDPQSPAFIETIRKGGYRLLPPVEPVVAPRHRSYRRAIFAGAILVTILLAGVWARTTRDTEVPVAPHSSRPLTSLEGDEQWPSLSADGEFVAFTWSNPAVGDPDIYAKRIGEASPVRVTFDPGLDALPLWMAGNDSLTYLHLDAAGSAIRMVSFPGGEPRDLLRGRGIVRGFSWIDEGRLILYSDTGAPDAESEQPDSGGLPRIWIRDLHSEQDRLLFEPSPGDSDAFPAISPDGNVVAFIRSRRGAPARLFVVPAEGGQPRQVLESDSSIDGFSWTRDSRSIVFSSAANGNHALWRVDVDSGDVSWVPVTGEWMFFPAAASHADRLVYQHRQFEKNVWQVSRPETGRPAESTSATISSSRWDCEARLSPDGSRMAFVSTRSGFLEIWVSNPDGSHPVQATHFGGPSVASPHWSPDGSRLAFSASPGGFSSLFTLDPLNLRQSRISDSQGHDLFPTWSHDGQHLIFSSDRTGEWQIWRTSPHPDSTAVQLTFDGGIYGRQAPDGSAVYFARTSEQGLWRLGVGESVPTSWQAGPRAGEWSNWDVFRGGIVYLDYDQDGPGSGAFLMERLFGSSEPLAIAAVPSVAAPSIAVTADGSRIFYARVERVMSDLMMVDGFR